jgi:hypothetical protein
MDELKVRESEELEAAKAKYDKALEVTHSCITTIIMT